MTRLPQSGHRPGNRSGNVLFLIMIAIILIAALTYAISHSERGDGNLSREQTAIRAAKVVSFATDIKRAVDNLFRSGKSESSISFAASQLTGYGTADTAPANEVFNIAGGGVGWSDVPDGTNDGSQWEFYGFTAVPNVGTAEADLIMVLPNVTQKFCQAYNEKAGFAAGAAIPSDTDACVSDTAQRFSGTFATDSDINTFDMATFPATDKPYPAACVACGTSYQAYYTLMER